MLPTPRPALTITGGLLLAGVSLLPRPLPVVEWNDNVRPAGTLVDGKLTLDLEVVRGNWHVLGPDQPAGEIYAFAERGNAPQNPGPMIRVPLGTEITVTIHNPFDSMLVVHGLSARRTGFLEPVRVEPGTTRRVTFPADVEGTYFYWASYGDLRLDERLFDDSQLHGALVVDPPGAVARDRVLIMGLWAAARDTAGNPDVEYLVVNGRPWPYTERLQYDLGDSIRWRVINATERGHPMHLHGFFFRVDARGDLARDTLYWPNQRRMAVTENMDVGTTMNIVWSPDRPGRWIFHCHISWHVAPNMPMGPDRPTGLAFFGPLIMQPPTHDPHDAHALTSMGGLMIGTYVQPPPGWKPHEPKRRAMRLFIQSTPAPGTVTGRRFSYVLQRGVTPPTRDSIEVPASTLVLHRGEPTSITVLNRTDEPSQIHWHGLEIESYFDGVAGFGGYPNRITPAIAPGDSFEIRITPPRAGSFMYHTHVSDLRQQSAGLYGAFVVLDSGEAWDPRMDRVVLIGYVPSGFEEFGRVAINGTLAPDTLDFAVDTTYRLRFMNITLDRGGTHVRLVQDGHPVRWMPVAKDGFDLPPHQRIPAFADAPLVVGETADFLYRPDRPGELRIEVRGGGGRLLVEQVVRVLEPPGAP